MKNIRDLAEMVRDYRRAILEQRRLGARIQELKTSGGCLLELEELNVARECWARMERLCLRRLRGEEEE